MILRPGVRGGAGAPPIARRRDRRPQRHPGGGRRTRRRALARRRGRPRRPLRAPGALAARVLARRPSRRSSTTRSRSSWPSPSCWRPLAPGALVPPAGLLRDPLGLGVVLFTVSALVSTALSISRWTSLLGANESYVGLGTVVAYAILFLTTRSLVTTARDAQRLILASVVAAGVAATYALVQVAGLDPILYGRTSGLAGLSGRSRRWATRTSCRPSSRRPSRSSCYALVRALRAGQRGVASVMAAIVIVAGAATAASVSRGAWLALAAAVIVLAARRPRHRRAASGRRRGARLGRRGAGAGGARHRAARRPRHRHARQPGPARASVRRVGQPPGTSGRRRGTSFATIR